MMAYKQLDVRRRHRDVVRWKRSGKRARNSWRLQHNSPAYRSLVVNKHFAKHEVAALEQSPYSPGLSPPDFLFFPLLKSCLKGQLFRERRGSLYKRDDSTDRVIEKWFPGMLPRALRPLAKVCHCTRELY
jgi:hypothetical protein